MMHFDDQTSLIQALFAAGVRADSSDEAPWRPFLERLRQVTQADGAALSIEQEGGSIGCWSTGTGAAPAPEIRQNLRNDRIYAQDSLPAGAETKGFIRLVKVRAGLQAHVVLWAQRAAHRKDFRSADGQYLSALVPYLGQAGEIWIGLRRERRRAALNARLGTDLGARWLLFDRTGTVMDMSSGMQTGSLPGIGRLGLRLSARGRLELSDPLATQRLHAALSACASGADSPLGLTLAHDPVVELILTRDATPGEGLILGFLRETPRAAHVPTQQIARHFGLSRSEARLATLLCDGFALRAAAAELGWTEETARSCSKKIYAQTDVRGQTGLVRKMLGSAVWFRGGGGT